MDSVLAKIIWDREACDFFTSLSECVDDDDITLLDLSKEEPLSLDDYVTCNNNVRQQPI